MPGRYGSRLSGLTLAPSGEMKINETLYQRQIATTIAALLGFNFKPDHPVMEPISTIYGK